MAEVVEADAAESGLAKERAEGAGEIGRVDWVPGLVITTPRTAAGEQNA
jgi:hypothetical protein